MRSNKQPCRPCRLLGILLLLFCWFDPVSGRIRLSILERYWYSAAVADFGFQFPEGEVYEADMMLPPKDDPFLCQYPMSFANVNPDDVVEFRNPIALLVSQGGCSTDQKARVALALNRNFSDAIQYVIVHNNEVTFANRIPSLTSETVGEERKELDALGFLSVSTISAASMQGLLWWRSTTPHLSPQGTDGSIAISMENFPDEDIPSVRQQRSSESDPEFFFLLRFVLFGVFICAPCLRAAYLWRSGGGRIGFRRNEQGRVTGLRYISPDAHWFINAPARNRQNQGNRVEGLLTEEQVLELPEIAFKPKGEASATSDEDSPLPNDEEDPCATVSALTDTQEEVSTPEEIPVVSYYVTTCTMCSICIEEFDANERIRVLPRCGHAYHTSCLMPWLTERHAYCPLCKTDVVERTEQHLEEGEDLETDQEEQSEETPAESAPRV